MIADVRSLCTIHGPSNFLWCPSCDDAASVERDPFTGRAVSAEEKRAAVLDALRVAGLSVAQVDLVMRTLESGESGVSDDQLARVLSSVQGSRVSAPQEKSAAPETPGDAAAALRDAGWSEDRIADALK